ncbi:hypothetical protein Poly41_17140 [Novipirellula artificiosorum]|uniref:Uncharacterized protein n=1 Tax=Novipirellula artificiosorum TaxID=2528016 RepID=A0A5C6E123_9BACT|nr:hypothetical protein Poly41_17140 [Novipirellula artificiosorum]
MKTIENGAQGIGDLECLCRCSNTRSALRGKGSSKPFGSPTQWVGSFLPSSFRSPGFLRHFRAERRCSASFHLEAQTEIPERHARSTLSQRETLAHPAEACAGGFRGISPVSHHCWQELFSLVIVQLPGETEWSSAEVQLDKGYPGRRCAKGATGSRRTTVRWGLFSKRSLDTGAIPPKNLESGFRVLPSDEPKHFPSWPSYLSVGCSAAEPASRLTGQSSIGRRTDIQLFAVTCGRRT